MNKKYFIGATLSSFATLGIDSTFHHLFTTPQETFWYYLIKLGLAYIISLIILLNFSYIKALIGMFVFTSVFALYYRFNEYFYSQEYGSRVPTIVFGNINILFQEQTFLNILIWFIVHAGAFAIPLIITNYVIDYFE